MYIIELGKCKWLTPSTSKLVDSFRSYDTSKTRGPNWYRKIRFYYYLLWMLLSWQFQLAFAKYYGRGLLQQWPGHSPNLNLIENRWRPVPILILFLSHFILFHFIPFHSIPIELPMPILTTCLQSVIAPKRIDRIWCAWCQSIAFSQLYMIHIKKSKIE
jgi:hypothetical protein